MAVRNVLWPALDGGGLWILMIIWIALTIGGWLFNEFDRRRPPAESVVAEDTDATPG